MPSPPSTTAADPPDAAGGRAAGAWPIGRLDTLALFALGFGLQFNVLMSNFGLPTQRLSDLLPFFVIPLLARREEIRKACLARIGRIGLVLLCLFASLVLKTGKSTGDLYLTLVLLLYVVQALELVPLFGDGRLAAVFCWGIVAGFPPALAVLVAQSVGLDLTGLGLGVSVDPSDLSLVGFMQDKLGGLWTAGNETGHVFALTGAAALFLAVHHRRAAIYVAYYAGLALSFPLTNNRAGLLAPTIVLLLLLRRAFDLRAVLVGAGALAAMAVASGVTGQLLLPEGLTTAVERRFADDSNVGNNADERMASTLGSVRLAITDPFGIGVEAKQDQLSSETGLETSHNGILSLALQSGICVAVLFLLGSFRILAAPWRFGDLAPGIVLFMMPSLFFEDLSVNQFTLFFIGVVLAHWALCPGGGAPEVPRPDRAGRAIA